MLLVLYALVLWIVASVPLALFFGAVCRLNEWPLDTDAEQNTRVRPYSGGKEMRTAGPALGARTPVRT
jgi:hypothetical protein